MLVTVVVHSKSWVGLQIASFLGRIHCPLWYYEGCIAERRVSGSIPQESSESYVR